MSGATAAADNIDQQTMRALPIVILLALSACATFTPLSPDEYPSVEAVEEHSLAQSEAYALLMRWAAETYGSANEVIQLADEENGTIVAKGAQPMMGFRAEYTMTMDVRDGRVRFRQRMTGYSGATYPSPSNVEQIEAYFAALRQSALSALNTEDDF